MTTQWYYQREGQQFGPVSAEQLKQFAASGLLQPTDLVWKEGLGQWVTASKVRGVFASTSPNVGAPNRPLIAQTNASPPPPPVAHPEGTNRETLDGGPKTTRRKKRAIYEFKTPRCPQCRSKHTVWLYGDKYPALKFLSMLVSYSFLLAGMVAITGTVLTATIIFSPFGIFLLIPSAPIATLLFIVTWVLYFIVKGLVPYQCQDCGHIVEKG